MQRARKPISAGSAILSTICLVLLNGPLQADDPALPRACIDGTGPDWQVMTEADFAPVNGDPDTWSWHDGILHCTGEPVGVTRLQKIYTNFELVVEWRHLRSGRQFGRVCMGARKLAPGLAQGPPANGIEVQVLDHGYAEHYEKQHGKKPDWFTTNGDVFPVGSR